jgi:hypothetical protein
MRASHDLEKITTSFDEPNLVPNAGLLAPALLAQKLGIAELVDAGVRLPAGRAGRANCGAKAMTVLGGLLAGADSIDDLDVLRSGAFPQVFDDLRAPSTIGTWLRGFDHGTVRQLDAVSRVVLARAWAVGCGPVLAADLTIDADSTICRVFGPDKEGAAFGYTKVRGLHPMIATLAGHTLDPDRVGGGVGQVLHTRLRGGSAAAARGAGSFFAETLARVRAAGATGRLTLRADSGFYTRSVVAACARAGAAFSITARSSPKLKAAISGIDEAAWTAIPYWSATEEQSTADVAEVPFTIFAGKPEATDVRLVVRRTQPAPSFYKHGKVPLIPQWRYHAFVTNRAGNLLAIEADHRRHAVVEQVIADLKGHSGLAHLPSGQFPANAAWLTLVALAYNLGRWALALTPGWANQTTATLRRTLLAIPGRLVHTARRLHLRLPTDWPWAAALDNLLTALRRLPGPAPGRAA